MAYTTVFEDITFVEGDSEFIEFKGKVEYKKTIFNQQLKNLDDIKHQLADSAKKLGANAIINFKYGQKSLSFFKAMFFATDDNVNWFATGDAVVIADNQQKNLT